MPAKKVKRGVKEPRNFRTTELFRITFPPEEEEEKEEKEKTFSRQNIEINLLCFPDKNTYANFSGRQ